MDACEAASQPMPAIVMTQDRNHKFVPHHHLVSTCFATSLGIITPSMGTFLTGSRHHLQDSSNKNLHNNSCLSALGFELVFTCFTPNNPECQELNIATLKKNLL